MDGNLQSYWEIYPTNQQNFRFYFSFTKQVANQVDKLYMEGQWNELSRLYCNWQWDQVLPPRIWIKGTFGAIPTKV